MPEIIESSNKTPLRLEKIEGLLFAALSNIVRLDEILINYEEGHFEHDLNVVLSYVYEIALRKITPSQLWEDRFKQLIGKIIPSIGIKNLEDYNKRIDSWLELLNEANSSLDRNKTKLNEHFPSTSNSLSETQGKLKEAINILEENSFYNLIA